MEKKVSQLKVKKYNNRKLYSEKLGSTSLESLRNEVLNGSTLKVVMHNTNEDITKEILLSLIDHTKFTESELLELIKR